MKEDKEMIRYLKEEAEKLEIPQSITPQEMRKKLEERENEKKLKEEHRKDEKSKYKSKKRNSNRRKGYEWGYVVAAACFCLLVGNVFVQKNNIEKLWERNIKSYLETETIQEAITTDENSHLEESLMVEGENIKEQSIEDSESAEQLAAIQYPKIAYEDIYESMFGKLSKVEVRRNGNKVFCSLRDSDGE